MAMARAEAENIYGMKLAEIKVNHAPGVGFGRDEGATVRKAYEGIVNEMGEEAKHHIQVSENIQRMVLQPFGKWTDIYRGEIDRSADYLKTKLKVYEREGQEVQKVQRKYFNKCRLLDEARETEEAEHETNGTVVNGLDEDLEKTSLKEKEENERLAREEAEAKAKAEEEAKPSDSVYEDDDDEPIELAEVIYSTSQVRVLLKQMLTEIHQKEVKVPIMGTYSNVSIGSDIVSWLQDNVTSGNMAIAEQFGQDLIQNGFLRLVGQVGNKFANSSVFNYQWKKAAFQTAHMEKPGAGAKENAFSPFVSEYLSGTINNYLNNTNQHPDETPMQKLQREVRELDTKYRNAVIKLDDARCELEEGIFEHLSSMERCESNRVHAIKRVMLDFLACLSNVVPSIQASVDKYLLYQETVVPERDLLYFIESYKTGSYAPRVPVYDNYYSPAEGWTFGIDLELRCRGDGKRVPLVISSILRHLDNEYPVLENDEVRLNIWTQDVPLKEVHALRKEINTGLPIPDEIFAKYPPSVVAGVLKIYLRELPSSIVPSMFYDSIKLIYTDHGNDEDASLRVRQIQATFGQMRISNIAVLDVLTRHLSRLMEIANPGAEYRDKLAHELAPCVLRPRNQTAITLGDRHPQRLVRDLIEYRREIISDLKRHSSSGGSRSSSMRSVSGASMRSQNLRPHGNSVSITNPEDTALYRAPLQRGSLSSGVSSYTSKLDPGSMKLRNGTSAATTPSSPLSPTSSSSSAAATVAPQARKPISLYDGPSLESVLPGMGPADSANSTSSNSASTSYVSIARDDSPAVAPTALSTSTSPSGARHGEVTALVESDSDDEPAITHVQCTPNI